MLYAEKKDLRFSRLALGTWAMGAGKDWGPADKSECIKAVHAALSAGVNLIDTAPIYGNYRAELLTGEALKGRRDKVILATKCGLKPGERAVSFDLSAKAVRKEAEDSLKRLQTDYIDIYLIHWPDRNTPLEETFGEFEKLKKEGKIRTFGLCNFDETLLLRAKQITEADFVQNEYSLLKRNEAPLKFCEENKSVFMAYGALGGGILSGKYKKEPCLPRCSVKSFFYRYYKGEAFLKSQKAADVLKETANKHKATTAQAALNFVLAQSPRAVVLFGARNAKQAEENASAANWQFTQEDLDYINERLS
ncbi:MAG: aldo/keto reductase [Elusimicrobia bacterium]|nr:aldo/keto reductase [Elusimicrobiota bacterium]